MSAHATKRRKLRHSSKVQLSDVDSHGETHNHNGRATTSNGAAHDTGHHDGDSLLDDEYRSTDGSDSEAEEELGKDIPYPMTKTDTPKTPVDASHRTKKPSATAVEDGVYTAEVYKSNMFKLQLDELLEQVKLKYGKKEAPAENAMRTLKALIEQLPSRTALSIPEAKKTLKSEGVTIPFPEPQPPQDAKYQLQYERPSNINASGSYPLKTTTRSEDGFSIDLVVTMPRGLFQEKDYLNHRYFYKRAFYLACIAAGIKASTLHAFNISFDNLGGNQLQPILVVRPSQRGGADDFSSSNCRIHVLLALPENAFAMKKLLPTSNCIRPNAADDEGGTRQLPSTPFYNSSIQSDASITSYLQVLHSASTRCDAYKDACILGRIWLKQRGFGSHRSKGGFGNFEWAAVTALLLLPNQGYGTSTLSPGYSSYQMFKATLQFLASHNLSRLAYKFQAQDISLPKDDTTPVFFDGPRNLNILYEMTSWSYARLQFEAKTTTEALTESRFDQFESTFILKVDSPKVHYDSTVSIPLSSLVPDAGAEYSTRLYEQIGKIYLTLLRALTDRVKNISFTIPTEGEWPIADTARSISKRRCILVNMITNPAAAHRTVDHGPSAESKKEAASFRQFWGEKAELRRFKDGSILESVVWATKDASAPVIEQIVSFILGKHLGVDVASTARFSTDSFSHFIPSGRIQGQSGVTPFTQLMSCLATLEQDIRNLEGLPLQIRHISAADAQLRYTSTGCPSMTDPSQIPASIVVQFEGSARWPDDLCAIQRTKIAFLLKMSELLSGSKEIYTTRVGLENTSQPSQNQAFLDVTIAHGFSFRLRIHHDREATLLERQLKDKSLNGQSRETAALALGVYKRDYLRITAHTRAIQTLCTRFPSLSPAIRLTKRWFSSHFLSSHFSTELIELMVARTFLQPYPWPVPSCATVGFLRTLAWISRWDWRNAALIVDFSSYIADVVPEMVGTGSQVLKTEDIGKIQTRFEAWRQIDPAMNRLVIFAATNLDTEGSTWTDNAKPPKVVAARMTALAKAAMASIRQEDERLLSIVNNGPKVDDDLDKFSTANLFTPTVHDFDIVFSISSKYSKSGRKVSEQNFKNLQIQGPADTQSKGYEPFQPFVEELQAIYGDSILWFWDPEACNMVAGLWNPAITAQRPWKVKAGWSSVPLSTGQGKQSDNVDKAVKIQLNKGSICNDILRLGGDMIDRIEMWT
ncbi:Nrap protein [Polyplosphaeria fusca]|uniref:U3 small nucleolar RNA-associated protein 22 n=1 Tax=Polyplosphaeria fusca TaxID=682080 RepID=A0A9P4V2Y4_9PLEO|nr:Nrap protein [Polyplosphaeria fusca]